MNKIFKADFNGKSILGILFLMGAFLAALWYILSITLGSITPQANQLTPEQLKAINASRYKYNDSLFLKTAQTLQEGINRLTAQQEKRDSMVNYINNTLIPEYNEKIKSIDTMSLNDVYGFWSKEYKRTHKK